MLRNGSEAMKLWVNSPIKPLLKIHIFNYTNIDAVLAGREKKIKIQDVGPYVYEETLQRTKLSFLEENKITFYVSLMIIIEFNPSDTGLIGIFLCGG